MVSLVLGVLVIGPPLMTAAERNDHADFEKRMEEGKALHLEAEILETFAEVLEQDHPSLCASAAGESTKDEIFAEVRKEHQRIVDA